MINKDLLSDIIDSLSSMISYADDGSLDRDDKDFSVFFEEVDKANEILNKLYKIFKEMK